MIHLSLFDDFTKVEESFNFDSSQLFESKINQMFSLIENNNMVAWSIDQFKDFFGGKIFEGHTEEESNLLLEKAYFNYEMGMLYEARSEWFDREKDLYEFGRGAISYLKSDNGYYLLFKNGKGFMISEKSMEMLKNKENLILEGWFDDAWNWAGNKLKQAKDWTQKNVIEPIKTNIVDPVVNKTKEIWGIVSDGARKVWEFSKEIISATLEFLKENWTDILFYISLVLQVIAGIVSFIPLAGQALGPILLIIAGAIQVTTGGADIYKGFKIIKEAPFEPEETGASEFIKGGAKLFSGAISMLLGIYEVSTSAKAAVPAAGAVDAAVGGATKTWVKTTVKSLKTTKSYVAMFKTVVEWITSKIAGLATKAVSSVGAKEVVKVGTKETVKAVSKLAGKKIGEYANNAIIPVICMAGSYGMSWVMETILKAAAGAGKIFDTMLLMPKKLSSSIDSFQKNHTGSWIGRTIGSALSGFVKPAADVVGKFAEDKIRPLTKPATDWLTSLPEANKFTKDRVEKEEKLYACLTGNPVPNPGEVKTPAQNVKVTKQDIVAMDAIDGNKETKSINKNFAKKEGGLDLWNKIASVSKEGRKKARKGRENRDEWKKAKKEVNKKFKDYDPSFISKSKDFASLDLKYIKDRYDFI
jgi:hypothetical protein